MFAWLEASLLQLVHIMPRACNHQHKQFTWRTTRKTGNYHDSSRYEIHQKLKLVLTMSCWNTSWNCRSLKNI